MPVVVSSALETSLGLAAGVSLAASLPRLDHACGLATRSLLTADVADPELFARDGMLPVALPLVLPAWVGAVEAPPDRVAWWEARLAAVLAVRQGRRP
jgi:O-succinylbenzoate synthase